MTPSYRLNLDAFPDSAYARELRGSTVSLNFDEPLEQEYVAAHLQRVHLRVRIWFSLCAALTLASSSLEVLRTGIWTGASPVRMLLLTGCNLALAALVWSRYYERRYLSFAPLLVSVRGGYLSIFVGMTLPFDGYETLAILTANLMAVFLFDGLKFRQALVAGVIMLCGFPVGALMAGLAPVEMFKAMWVLLPTAVLAAIVYRDMETAHRRSFLERALIGELSARDGLSGLMNRRSFDEQLLRLWNHAARERRSISTLMIDIDHFKTYNDNYGHQAGDLVIRVVARCLKELARRPLDLAARYGGEEFILVLYDVSSAAAFEIAERLRTKVQKLDIDMSELNVVEALTVTVSVGVSVVMPRPGRSAEEAMQLADEGLYDAKTAGRNRVVVKWVEDSACPAPGALELA